jgi:outer membrane protein OmpA-like peptidoglycan-associated protein
VMIVGFACVAVLLVASCGGAPRPATVAAVDEKSVGEKRVVVTTTTFKQTDPTLFENGSSAFVVSADEHLRGIAATVLGNSDILTLSIVCSSIAGDVVSAEVSQVRATKVRSALIENGVEEGRLIASANNTPNEGGERCIYRIVKRSSD